MKYAPALAAAVTPIMKLDVAEETLMGKRKRRVHGGNLENAAADAQQGGDQAGSVHQHHAHGNAMHLIGNLIANRMVGIAGMQAERGSPASGVDGVECQRITAPGQHLLG